jgi:hypothetical protein
MSPASIDRYLRPAKATDQTHEWSRRRDICRCCAPRSRAIGSVTGSRPNPAASKAHWTVNLTDALCRWAFPRTVRNNHWW